MYFIYEIICIRTLCLLLNLAYAVWLAVDSHGRHPILMIALLIPVQLELLQCLYRFLFSLIQQALQTDDRRNIIRGGLTNDNVVSWVMHPNLVLYEDLYLPRILQLPKGGRKMLHDHSLVVHRYGVWWPSSLLRL